MIPWSNKRHGRISFLHQSSQCWNHYNFSTSLLSVLVWSLDTRQNVWSQISLFVKATACCGLAFFGSHFVFTSYQCFPSSSLKCSAALRGCCQFSVPQRFKTRSGNAVILVGMTCTNSAFTFISLSRMESNRIEWDERLGKESHRIHFASWYHVSDIMISSWYPLHTYWYYISRSLQDPSYLWDKVGQPRSSVRGWALGRRHLHRLRRGLQFVVETTTLAQSFVVVVVRTRGTRTGVFCASMHRAKWIWIRIDSTHWTKRRGTCQWHQRK